MKKILFKAVSALLAVCTAFACSACGGTTDGQTEGRTVIKFWPSTNQYTAKAVASLVEEYNDGQGKTDGVFVQVDLTKTDVSPNHYSICPVSVRNQTDILTVSDRSIFYGAGYASGSFYTDLSALVGDESLRTKDSERNYYFDTDDFADVTLNRFYFNRETKEAGNPESGSLYALPFGSNPTMLIYNETYFKNANVNIISVKEEDLAAYNSANSASYAPRGYCEYTEEASPAKGLKTSVNVNGEKVVKVFNNLIPMNFAELNTLSKNFTKTYNPSSPSDYGFLNEWWFSHGWAVGGNCIAWDNEKNQHVFTLGEKNCGYMAVKEVEIDGKTYKAGEILGYNARKTVAANESAYESFLYKLPSMYEQFRDFCALSQRADRLVDSSMYGYGISPDPDSFSNSSKIKYFTSGQVAMLVENFSSLQTIVDSTTAEIDVAPLYAFRSFEGEGELGNSELKIVGKTYDGVKFEGKIKKVNGVEIKNAPQGGSDNLGFAIPANSTKKEAAWKFLQYFCSARSQAKICACNNGVPTNTEYALSKEYADSENKLVKNYAAAGMMSVVCTIGDWSYLGDKEWIDDWSVDLNGPVRNGLKTLDAFFETWNEKVNGDVPYNKSLKLAKYYNVKWIGLR